MKGSSRRRDRFVVSGMVAAGHGVMVPVENLTPASEESTSESSDETDESDASSDESDAPPTEGEELRD